MYIYIYIYICIYIFIYINIFLCMCVYVYICICMSIYIYYVYMHVYMYVCIYIYIYIFVFIYLYILIYFYVCVCMYMYVYICTYNIFLCSLVASLHCSRPWSVSFTAAVRLGRVCPLTPCGNSLNAIPSFPPILNCLVSFVIRLCCNKKFLFCFNSTAPILAVIMLLLMVCC